MLREHSLVTADLQRRGTIDVTLRNRETPARAWFTWMVLVVLTAFWAFTVVDGDLDVDTIALLVAHPLGGGGGVLMILNNCGVIIIGLWSDSPTALVKV